MRHAEISSSGPAPRAAAAGFPPAKARALAGRRDGPHHGSHGGHASVVAGGRRSGTAGGLRRVPAATRGFVRRLSGPVGPAPGARGAPGAAAERAACGICRRRISRSGPQRAARAQGAWRPATRRAAGGGPRRSRAGRPEPSGVRGERRRTFPRGAVSPRDANARTPGRTCRGTTGGGAVRAALDRGPRPRPDAPDRPGGGSRTAAHRSARPRGAGTAAAPAGGRPVPAFRSPPPGKPLRRAGGQGRVRTAGSRLLGGRGR